MLHLYNSSPQICPNGHSNTPSRRYCVSCKAPLTDSAARHAENWSRLRGPRSTSHDLVIGVTTVVSGFLLIVGSFLPFSKVTVEGLATISRDAFQISPENFYGSIIVVLGAALINFGIGLTGAFNVSWLHPYRQCLFSIAPFIIVIQAATSDNPKVAGVSYSYGLGAYMSGAGAVIAALSALYRFSMAGSNKASSL